MIHDTKHLIYTAKPNEEMYWERVNRSLGWLGNTEAEAKRETRETQECCYRYCWHWWYWGTTCSATS